MPVKTETAENSSADEIEVEVKGKRTKERSIEDIIQKVSLWRRLYNGVLRDKKLVRYSLEDAAQKVDVSKKSLDDYLLQLRFGKKYNFNFQQHRNDKVGVLRSYVKKMKAQDVKKSGKNVSMIERVQKGSKKEKQMLDSLLKE